ncbi:conserved hypothetical protein [Agrobacterium fabrum str. J-07]|nr:conserved hypothetical protein [Agrobacterium fabrum str. J-07]
MRHPAPAFKPANPTQSLWVHRTEKPLMPKFVGQKATIMMGGTKLWKAMAKHATPSGTLLVAAL